MVQPDEPNKSVDNLKISSNKIDNTGTNNQLDAPENYTQKTNYYERSSKVSKSIIISSALLTITGGVLTGADMLKNNFIKLPEIQSFEVAAAKNEIRCDLTIKDFHELTVFVELKLEEKTISAQKAIDTKPSTYTFTDLEFDQTYIVAVVADNNIDYKNDIKTQKIKTEKEVTV